jgi:hypothetical protein
MGWWLIEEGSGVREVILQDVCYVFGRSIQPFSSNYSPVYQDIEVAKQIPS